MDQFEKAKKKKKNPPHKRSYFKACKNTESREEKGSVKIWVLDIAAISSDFDNHHHSQDNPPITKHILHVTSCLP